MCTAIETLITAGVFSVYIARGLFELYRAEAGLRSLQVFVFATELSHSQSHFSAPVNLTRYIEACCQGGVRLTL